MSDQHPDKAVVVAATAPNEMTADIWRQVLADEGIIAALKPGGVGFAFGTNVLNEHYILVRSDQGERARSIIAELESDEASDSSSS